MAPKLITQTEAADRLGISPRTVQRLRDAGDLPVIREGRRLLHPWPQTRTAYEKYRERKAHRQNGPEPKPPDTLDKAKLRKLQAEAELSELKAAQARGELIPLDAHLEDIRDHVETLRGQLAAIPGSWGPTLVGCRTVPEAVSRLSGLVELLLKTLQDVVDEG